MTTRKHFFTAFVVSAMAAPAFAAALVNINTADLATLETLNGIGPSKAQAVIDYRTLNGPFAAIEDIQNVSGIGPSTYANIKDFITVSDSQSSDTQTQTQEDTSATTTSSVGSGSSPPPIRAVIGADSTAVTGAGTEFSGSAFGAQGEPLGAGVRYIWNFGDGATAEGARAVHTFAYPGEYDIELEVAYNYSSATARRAVAAVTADVALLAEGDGSLTLANYAAEDLSVGRWSFAQGTSTFTIPEGTMVLAGKGVRFAPAVLGFLGDMRAALLYPNGSRAAQAAASASSPLRGQVVELPSAKQARSAESSTPTPARASLPSLNDKEQSATVAQGVTESEWSYFLGLAAVIALGVIGTYYAYMPERQGETEPRAEEFEIE